MKALIEKSVIEFFANPNYDKAKKNILEVCISIKYAQIAIDYSSSNYSSDETQILVGALLDY